MNIIEKLIIYIIVSVKTWIKNVTTWIKNHKVGLQRFFKLITYCALLFGLCFQTRRFYTKLKITPEIFTKENFVKGREIPFPAVTFCPNYLVKAQKSQIFVKYSELTKDREEFRNIFGAINLNEDARGQPDENTSEKPKSNKRPRNQTEEKPLEKPQKEPSKHDEAKIYQEARNLMCHGKKSINFNLTEEYNDLMDILKILSPNFGFAIRFAELSNDLLNQDNFISSFTEFGICFTFNSLGHNHILNDEVIYAMNIKESSLNAINWNLHHGYHSNDEIVYPLRASPYQKLEIDLINQLNEDYCREKSYIRFHLPNELPTFLSFTYEKSAQNNNYFRITAEIKHIDESLKEFSPKHRGCFFDGEKKLKFFKSYTKANCEYECMVNFTHNEYGCVPFLFLHTEDMEICTNASILNQNKILRHWPEAYYTEQENKHLLPVYPCDCMEPCTQVNYNVPRFSFEKALNMSNSEFTVIFTSPQISNITTYITYQLENFTFDVAGLFGIFLGSSIASLFLIPIKVYGYIKNILEKFYHRMQRKPEKESEHEANERSKSSQDLFISNPEDRPPSAMSEISQKIYILSQQQTTFVPVTKSRLELLN